MGGNKKEICHLKCQEALRSSVVNVAAVELPTVTPDTQSACDGR
jgi:hypothetical protein